jgi:hypothetical protein
MCDQNYFLGVDDLVVLEPSDEKNKNISAFNKPTR